tara:strand:+ start:88 stop:984 length:897 start_codon:yes stop_codon:yes gene_type:complete
MAALAFPNNPDNGETYTTSSGITYTWNESDSVWTSGQVADLPLSGGTLTGPLTLSGAPTASLHAVTKAYADTLTTLGTQGDITLTGKINGPASFIIDPAPTGNDVGGTVIIKGDLQVDGTTTTINSTTLEIDDKAITLAKGSNNKASADGSGIIVDCGSNTDATILYDSGNNQWDFNNEIAGTTATFTGTVSAQGSVLTSDKRFKKNVTDAKSQLADVVALGNSLKNWDWTDDAPIFEKDVRSLGLIAQDVEEICPSLVVTQERTDDPYKAIKNDVLIMKILGAVAELSAKIDALESG